MDVAGIGLANIDLVAHVSDDFLRKHKVKKGFAKKVDDLAFARLRAELDQYDAIPGGCVANTLCGLSSMGAETRFFGKIGEDSFESLYRASFKDYSVGYDVAAGRQESSQCAVLVTPDGERSFAFMHGASWDLAPTDIDWPAMARASLIYAEIYFFEFGEKGNLANSVIDFARQQKIPMAMKVMDAEFGRRYAQQIQDLTREGVLSLMIGNHENMPSVAGTETVEDTVKAFQSWPCDTLLTTNKDGSYFIGGGEARHYPVEPIENPKNTTGAGDQFAAGFLMGYLDDRPLDDCMGFAAASARTILMHDTARPPLGMKRSIRF